MEIIKNQSLQTYNTFGIKASAHYFTSFKTIEELKLILEKTDLDATPTLILGGGSNLLFTRDFNGLVLKNEIKGLQIIKENIDHVWVKAGAGETWHDLVLFSIENNLGGIENLSLIPGTVGASPIQNIGAYGVEIKDTLDSLEALHLHKKELQYFNNPDCEFGYRDSIFKKKRKGEFIITSVIFRLNKNPSVNVSYGAIQDILKQEGIDHPTIKSVSDAVIKIRKSKLPDPAEIGNAGSFFKNPEVDGLFFANLKNSYPSIPSFPTHVGHVKIPAGWLIEQCGWKGKIVGNTGVHKNQALVLVNYGGATGLEIKQLAENIQNSVREKFNISLETEVNII